MAPVERLDALGKHVARQEEALVPSEGDHERLRAALAAHAGRNRGKGGSRARHVLLGSAAIAAAAMILGALFVRRPGREELRFFVGAEHVPGEVGRFMSAPDTGRLPIAFSDGSRVELEAHTRGRVVSVNPQGADLLVEEGRATIAVVPRAGNRWEVSTGPFAVHVTGTRFGVEWHPDQDRFVLELYEGHVRISGCALGDGQSVDAGERVEASCLRGELRVSRLGATEKEETLVAAAAGPSVAASPAVPQGPPAGPAPRAPTWIDQAREGRYTAAYAASVLVFEDVCATGSARDVLLLGDAARLTGHFVEAARAYEAVRSRFGATDSSALAAFELGRQDFDQRRDYGSALRWLRAYLDEQPRGTFAPAAMGRLIEAEVHLGRLGPAREVAERYLARYPKGPHAETARRVLSTSGEGAPR